MHFFITLARMYPWQSAAMVAALLLAGILEGIGLSMLLPLLSLAVNRSTEGSAAISASNTTTDASQLEQVVNHLFSVIGLTPTVEALLTAMIIAIVLKSVVMLVAKKQVGYAVARVATDLRLDLLRSLLATRWEHYLSHPVGSLANAMATEAHRASRAYMCGVMMMAFCIQAIIYAVIALLVSWKITLIGIAAGVIILYLLKRFVRKSRKAGWRQTNLLKSMLALMADALQSIKPLKAMGRERLADIVLEKKTNRLNKALQKQVFNKEALKAFQEPLMMVFLAIGLYVVLVHWHMPLTTVIVLVYLTAHLMKQLGKIQERYQEMVTFESAYWSLQDTIEGITRERESVLGTRQPSLVNAIRFDSVSFAYKDKEIIHDTSIDFPAGKITAVIGPSGSGKTTMMDLIIGLLRPQAGEVWIDDLPLSDIELRSWRHMIGYVPQETLLLHDSILNNVTLGDPHLRQADALEALQAAGISEFIKTLPEGLHSTVGERGGKLSGGQRQRIAIARALVHKPHVLILDEPTSALDPENEAAIFETLNQLRGKLTILVISHRPGLVDLADLAYRMHNGKVVRLNSSSANGLHGDDAPGTIASNTARDSDSF